MRKRSISHAEKLCPHHSLIPVGAIWLFRYVKAYNHDWIGKLLRRWGFSWQQVEKHAVERDLEKIDAWLEEELPALEKKGRSWRNDRVGR
ncbi:winged helix-turn-helix domain-containing protein [Deinococcus antarcticus]|uniref:Winged helix-turn-helix domain-containing protein n=1 Tax=Deinococcus antarcticus TaxID=1298767 RepID=A0ABV8A4H2_9DEIO